MKLKNTLTLLVIAGGLFGFIWFWEKDLPSSQRAVENAGRVVQFNRDEIDGITIKNTGTTIELSKSKKGLWTMKKPLEDRADSSAIVQLFTAAEALQLGLINRVVPDNELAAAVMDLTNVYTKVSGSAVANRIASTIRCARRISGSLRK